MIGRWICMSRVASMGRIHTDDTHTSQKQGGGRYQQQGGLFVKTLAGTAAGNVTAQEAAASLLGRGFMMGLETPGCAV